MLFIFVCVCVWCAFIHTMNIYADQGRTFRSPVSFSPVWAVMIELSLSYKSLHKLNSFTGPVSAFLDLPLTSCDLAPEHLIIWALRWCSASERSKRSSHPNPPLTIQLVLQCCHCCASSISLPREETTQRSALGEWGILSRSRFFQLQRAVFFRGDLQKRRFWFARPRMSPGILHLWRAMR